MDIYRFLEDVPYDSRDVPWHNTSVTTDDDGVFSLDLADLDVGFIVYQLGQPYIAVRPEGASLLRHTGSAAHISLVRSKAGKRAWKAILQ
jgi:hypothetical protein